MAFFNKLGDTLSSVGKDVVKKAKDLTDSTKYTSQIASEENKIAALYQAIGKEYFNEYGTDESAPYADYISEIKQHIAKIEKLKKLLQELKGVTLCPVCNKEIPTAALFCPSCGAKICAPAKEDLKEESPINSESTKNSGFTKNSGYTNSGYTNSEYTNTQSSDHIHDSEYDQKLKHTYDSTCTQNSECTAETKEPAIESEKFFCPNCGHSCTKNSKFCTSCGAKLD